MRPSILMRTRIEGVSFIFFFISYRIRRETKVQRNQPGANQGRRCGNVITREGRGYGTETGQRKRQRHGRRYRDRSDRADQAGRQKHQIGPGRITTKGPPRILPGQAENKKITRREHQGEKGRIFSPSGRISMAPTYFRPSSRASPLPLPN